MSDTWTEAEGREMLVDIQRGRQAQRKLEQRIRKVANLVYAGRVEVLHVNEVSSEAHYRDALHIICSGSFRGEYDPIDDLVLSLKDTVSEPVLLQAWLAENKRRADLETERELAEEREQDVAFEREEKRKLAELLEKYGPPSKEPT